MSGRAFKRFVRLTPQQIQSVSEQCLARGPYKVKKVTVTGSKAVVTVQYEDGRRDKVTV